MTTHLLIKAIALQVRALGMLDANHAEFSCGGAPVYGPQHYDEIEREINELAALAEEHVGPESVNLTTQMSIAASEGAKAGYDKILRDAIANASEQNPKLVGTITAPPPPLFEQLHLGYRYHGLANTGKHYIAAIKDTHQTHSIMSGQPVTVVCISIFNFDGNDVEPFNRNMSYEEFRKEFNREFEE